MAVLAFTEHRVEFAVTEAGLGGRFDATTALPADTVCFTPIGRDHLHVLGPELRDISADKAAALRAGALAVTAEQTPLVLQCLTGASRRVAAPLLPADESLLPAGLRLRLAGPHQQRNAALAATAWTSTAGAHDWPMREDALRKGLENAFLPGRLQSVPANGRHPHLLLDGAHNAPAWESLRDALKQRAIRPCALIFSCMADKELEAVIPPLLAVAGSASVFITPVMNNPRAAQPEQLAARIGPAAECAANMEAALEKSAGLRSDARHPVLICGSLYLLGDFFRLFPEHLTPTHTETS
jgi:dihydrofolate synthase/folylpolyglutamate synthase